MLEALFWAVFGGAVGWVLGGKFPNAAIATYVLILALIDKLKVWNSKR